LLKTENRGRVAFIHRTAERNCLINLYWLQTKAYEAVNPAKPRSYRPDFLQGYLPPTERAGYPLRGAPALRLFDIIQNEEKKLCRPPLRREGAFMSRGDRIIIMALAALGVVALIAMAVITLTEGSELLEFAIVMVFFIAVLLGSFWFMIAPAGRGEKEDSE